MGCVDVDELRDRITPEQMDRIEAAYRVKWQRFGLLAQHCVALLLNAQGANIEASDLDYLRTLDFDTEE